MDKGALQTYEDQTNALSDISRVDKRGLPSAYQPFEKPLKGEFNKSVPQAVAEFVINHTPGVAPKWSEAQTKAFIDRLISDPASYSPMGMMTRAFHGAKAGKPKFDKFDTKFIGSGEGGAARGWGFYLSDVDDIGEVYARRGADNTNMYKFDGNTYTSAKELADSLALPDDLRNIPIQDLVDRALSTTKSPKGALSWLQQSLDANKRSNSVKNIRDLEDAIDIVREVELVPGQAGYLYETTLHPNKVKENWLDWDSPVTEQHLSQIEDQLAKEGITNVDLGAKGNISIGGDLYHELTNVFQHKRLATADISKKPWERISKDMPSSKQMASEFLDRAGIDGIRFEAGSIMGPKPHVVAKKVENLTNEQAEVVVEKFFGTKYFNETVKTWKDFSPKEFLKKRLVNEYPEINDFITSSGFAPVEYNYVIFNPDYIRIDAIRELARSMGGTEKK